jgi:hypothetical protein
VFAPSAVVNPAFTPQTELEEYVRGNTTSNMSDVLHKLDL